MSRQLLLALVTLSFSTTAVAKKKKKKASEEQTEESVAYSDTLPSDGTSKKFAESLIETSIKDFKPTDAVGAKFVYNTLAFAPDATWKADGYVEMMDERMDCTENGTWSMEAADSADVATISWVVATTDCAGRDAGVEIRAQLTIGKDGSVDALFR